MSSQGVSGTTRSALRYHLESKFSLGVPPVPPVPPSLRQLSNSDLISGSVASFRFRAGTNVQTVRRVREDLSTGSEGGRR